MGRDTKSMAEAWNLWDRVWADDRVIFLPEPEEIEREFRARSRLSSLDNSLGQIIESCTRDVEHDGRITGAAFQHDADALVGVGGPAWARDDEPHKIHVANLFNFHGTVPIVVLTIAVSSADGNTGQLVQGIVSRANVAVRLVQQNRRSNTHRAGRQR